MKIKALVFILVLRIVTYAQDITGNIEGYIIDSSNVPLLGVNILLESENLQGTLGAATNDEGYFRIINLPVGIYNVKISFIGYQKITFQNIQIQLGKTTSLGEIKLNQQNIDLPELIISGRRNNIDPNSTVYGSNLQSKDFENLPIERNYQGMITILPQSNLSYYGDGVNIGGATGFENKYFVDGVEVTDPYLGISGTYLPYNFIKEVEVKAGGYEAEFQSALGGVINVLTNSGTNEFHGSFFGFYTGNGFTNNKKLGYLDPTQGNFSNYDAGFSLGGPIIRDKLWFFAAYNPTFANQSVYVPSFGYSIDKTTTNSFAAKLNWKALENLSFVFTSTGDPTTRSSVGFSIDDQLPLLNRDPYFQNLKEGGINYSLNGTYTLGSNIVLEGFFARINRYDTGKPSTERGNEIYFADYLNNALSGGTKNSWDSFRFSNEGKLQGTFLLDGHILGLGFQYKTNRVNNQHDAHIIREFYINDSTISYNEGISKKFGEVADRVPSIFIQDNWRLNQKINITAGLRWERELIIGSDGKVDQSISVPLEPRIGIVFIPDDKFTQKIFGSFGRYAQEFALFQATSYYSNNGYVYGIDFNHNPLINNSGGDTSYSNPSIISPEVKGLREQYYDEFSLGYERMMGWNFKVGIQGVYRTLREGIDNVWIANEKRYQIGNPGSGILSAWPKLQRDYRALIFTIQRTGDKHFNLLASYVLSRNYGNYEGLFDAIYHDRIPNNNLTFDDLENARVNATGLVPNDRTHLFKFSGYYIFSFGLITGITFTAQSGTPLSEYAGTDVGIKFLSPLGSNGRTPSIWDLNARFIYQISVFNVSSSRLILDIFHIASQLKPVDIDQQHYFSVDKNGNPIFLNPYYGKTSRYQQPMSIRLGMEVNF